MYSKHNEEKSVVPEIFIRTLKSKIYKYVTLVSKNLYIDKSDDIVNEYEIHMKENLKSSLLMLSLVIMLNTMLILKIKILSFKLINI